MKPLLILLFAMLFLGPLQAQRDFVIKGDLKGVEDGTPVMLFQTDGNVGTQVAVDTVRNGHFNLKSKGSDEVEDFTILCYGSEGFPPMSLQLFAKSGSRINVTGQNKLLKTWTVQSDLPIQKEYDRFIAENKIAWDEFQQLSVERTVLRKNSHSMTQEQFDKSSDSIGTLSDNVWKEIIQQEVIMLRQSAVSDVTMRYLKDAALFVKLNDEDTVVRQSAKSLYGKLDLQRQHSRLGEEIHSFLYPPVVVQKGEKMVDVELADRFGHQHHLADYRGKYLLLDFWSVGCGPCNMAVPELKQLSLSYKRQLEVIGVSLDTKKTWISSNNKEMTWTNLSDGKETRGIAARYGVNGMPHYSLISPEGVLLESWVGYDEGKLIAKVKEYIRN